MEQLRKKSRLLMATLTAALLFVWISGCAIPEVVEQQDPTTAYGNQLGAIEYTVRKGDNLVLIAADVTRERENWRLIAEFNRINNPTSLRVGQKIYIPRDLIPLGPDSNGSRQVAGQPGAVVNSITPRKTLESRPLTTE